MYSGKSQSDATPRRPLTTQRRADRLAYGE